MWKVGSTAPFFFEGVKYYSISVACSARTCQMGDIGEKMIIIKFQVSKSGELPYAWVGSSNTPES